MLKNLFVVRHGEAEHLIGDRLTGGWTDSSLTKLGQKQAASLGRRLKELIGKKEFALYCSDLSRAWQTAEIMAHYLGQSPVAYADLRELGNGDAANMPSQEARKIALPQTQPTYDWVHYPNGESWRDLNNRVFKFMASLKDKPEDTVVIVSHRKTILAIIHWWLDLSEEDIQKISFDIEPCSITYLRINKWQERTISKLNDTSHLLGEY